MEDIRTGQFKTGCIDFGISTLCLVFGLIYEHFGFGVRSPFMHFAFMIPLFLGAFPYLVATVVDCRLPLSTAGSCFLHAAIATFTVGSLFRGALDIYGTSSPLTLVYLFAGLICLLLCAGFSFHRSVNMV